MTNSDSESRFNELYGEVNENLSSLGTTGNTGATGPADATGIKKATGSSSHTGHTGRTQHPFSIRLDPEHVELIKALAWWRRISQRKLIEQALDRILEEVDEQELRQIIRNYRSAEDA